MFAERPEAALLVNNNITSMFPLNVCNCVFCVQDMRALQASCSEQLADDQLGYQLMHS